MSKHTPGPWHIYRVDVECPGIEAEACSIVIFGEKLTAEEECGVQGRTIEEAAANARLIAAAPELLEALIDLLAICDEELDAIKTPEMARARAAIAKAEGNE